MSVCEPCVDTVAGQVDIRLHGNGIQSPMVQGRYTKIISMIKWIRTSGLSINISLCAGQVPVRMAAQRSRCDHARPPQRVEVRLLLSCCLALSLSPSTLSGLDQIQAINLSHLTSGRG